MVEGTQTRFSVVVFVGVLGTLRWKGQGQLNRSAFTSAFGDGGVEELPGGGALSKSTSTMAPFSSTVTISERASSTDDPASGMSGP